MLNIEEIFQVISINVKRWEHSLMTWKNLRVLKLWPSVLLQGLTRSFKKVFTWSVLLLLIQVFYTPNVRQYYMSESQTWNHHMTNYKNDDSNNRVLSFRLKPATLSDCLILISILFPTLGAATEKARDAIFLRHLGMLSNCFWLDLRARQSFKNSCCEF